MVLRKLLASSSFAITDALRTIARRLRTKAAAFESELINDLASDYEALPTATEEWQVDGNGPAVAKQLLALANAEAEELERLADFAQTIRTNAKGEALLDALRAAFKRGAALGAPQKAVIFTESRKTQAYILDLLHSNGYADGLLSFDGSNSDPRSRRIHASWLSRWGDTDRASGSRSADVRAALVDYFRDEGRIMVATEAAAEGLNLQFCSLVVNYDLPWNPQRVEQRIGRCHRYGQRHDVVVVNLLNRGNAADRRVFQLLADKFRLFEGIFGASDEILGVVENGVDIERRIAEIYERCRTDAEIDTEFNELQAELDEAIQASVAQARVQLLENFDDEVREKLRIRERESVEQLDAVESALLDFTYAELGDRAVQRSQHAFELVDAPEGAKGVALGTYALPRHDGAAHVYRLDHPLATHLLSRARKQAFVTETVEYSYSSHRGKITALEPHVGKTGTLSAAQLTVTALDQVEDRLIVVAKSDDGTVLEDEIALRMLMLASSTRRPTTDPATESTYEGLLPLIEDRAYRATAAISVRNDAFYQAEAEKLSAWAEDLKAGLEQELKELDRLIREARRHSLSGESLETKLSAQRELRVLERQRAGKRRELFESQDKVDSQRDELILRVEKKLTQSVDLDPLFSVRWELT
jgi:adenine-specific DNA-methyltransferase